MIWGVGYGAVPKRVKNYSAVVSEGVPNIDTYGNFTPTQYWNTGTASGHTYLNILGATGGRTVQFDQPCKTKYNNLIVQGKASSGTFLQLGSTAGGTDYYAQRLQTKTNITDKQVISLQNVNVPFYISFYATISAPAGVNIYLTDDAE